MVNDGLDDVVVAKHDDYQRYAVVEEENASDVRNRLYQMKIVMFNIIFNFKLHAHFKL